MIGQFGVNVDAGIDEAKCTDAPFNLGTVVDSGSHPIVALLKLFPIYGSKEGHSLGRL
jgi:hypothetical protein